MTLKEKIAELTPEQFKKLSSLRTMEQLDAFLAENSIKLTDEEYQAAAEYFKTGNIALSDDEMEMVTGGKTESSYTMSGPSEKAKTEAAIDGRIHQLPSSASCLRCKNMYNLYARSKPTAYLYKDVKCYSCNNVFDMLGAGS